MSLRDVPSGENFWLRKRIALPAFLAMHWMDGKDLVSGGVEYRGAIFLCQGDNLDALVKSH